MDDVRLIDANALLKELEKQQEQQTNEYCDCFLNDAQELSTEWWCVEDAVMAAPTIDAVPVVHGRWVKANGMMPPEYHGRKCCSVCDAFALSDFYGIERLSDFCHNCGAKMDGGEQDA